MNTSYGGYYGGDPRKFHPDEEMCTAAEIAAHRAACAAWDRGERPGPRVGDGGCRLGKPCPRPYGIGVTIFDEEAPEEIGSDKDLNETEDDEFMDVYLGNFGKDAERGFDMVEDDET